MNKINPSLFWLKNGILALAIAGAYSIILVMLRTPGVNAIFADKDIFKSALVIHVNLSVLVWLLSIIGIIWSNSKIQIGLEILFSRLALGGMIMMAISPLIGEKSPVMNNYIPMLENVGFIIGLSLFGVSVLLASVSVIVCTIFEIKSNNFKIGIVSLTKLSSAILYQMIWLCFVLSFLQLDKLTAIVPIDIDFYYELLYWSGGHLLQFLYTQALMFVWYVLFEIWIGKLKFNFIYKSLLILNFILGSLLFYGHYSYQITDNEFKEFFTLHMIFAAGIAPSLFIIVLFYEAVKRRFINKTKQAPCFISASIFCSSLLFLSGGLIGAAISGVNVTIPAHYHGSIVGISVAFMGLAYVYCYGLLELDPPTTADDARLAKIQIYLITIGQILHIAGLGMAGGYGVLRKTPGEEMLLSAKIYMGMVGIGGLVAIIGGLMFVYICAKKLYSS
jgi:hypothetical protein